MYQEVVPHDDGGKISTRNLWMNKEKLQGVIVPSGKVPGGDAVKLGELKLENCPCNGNSRARNRREG